MTLQTMYALAAMMLASMLSLNMQRGVLRANTRIMHDEIDMMAFEAGEEVLDYIETLPFDENYPVSSASELTLPENFGSEESAFYSALDIDDLHDKQLTMTVPTKQDSISFDIQSSVRYVQGQNFVGCADPSYFKEVTLTVQGPLDSTIKLARIYSYK